MKTILLIIPFILTASISFSDTLYLKDGSIVNAENVWEEDGYVMYTLHGGTVGVLKEKVVKVEPLKKKAAYFQFGVWSFGINVRKAFDIAENNNVPLQKYGIITVNKRFHSQVRHYFDASHFYYNTYLIGHFAKVELFFTPISKQLHTVKIQWQNQNTKDHKLTNEIMSMISEKYGHPQERHKKIFYTSTKWITKGNNQIDMNISSTSIDLTYSHIGYRKINFEEIEGLKAQKIKAGSQKDKNKF